jgi:hypothetical protein
MDGKPVLASVELDNQRKISACINKGCKCYAAIDEDLSNFLGLPLVEWLSRRVLGLIEAIKSVGITAVVVVPMKIHGFTQIVYAYRVPQLTFPILLGNPWKIHN